MMMMWKQTLLSLACLLVLVQGEIYLGSLGGGKSEDMDVAGDVYVISDKVVEVRSFSYNGEAPDALFYADASAEPSNDGTLLLPASHNCSALKLGAYNGTETFRLEFTDGSTIQDVYNGSISVWCRAMQVNLGQIVVPETLDEDLLENDTPLVCSPHELTFVQSIAHGANVLWEVVVWLFVSRR